MNFTRLPDLPIPEPLRGRDPDSFAKFSVEVRLPEIARRTIEDNEGRLPQESLRTLASLAAGIPGEPIRLLKDRSAPDSQDWDRYLDGCTGLDWLEIPWFLAETYFFRRVLEATGYFVPGEGRNIDPYREQKWLSLEASQNQISSMCQALNRMLLQSKRDGFEENLAFLLQAALWGNQADMSLWPVGSEGQPGHDSPEKAQEYLLVDDAQALAGYLDGLRGQKLRIDFILDNAGFELAGDLALADYFLSAGIASKVRLHLKSHPTFVSDALIDDVLETAAWMGERAGPVTAEVGRRLERYRTAGLLELVQHGFWTSPLPAWEMPASLQLELGEAALVITKGDANYRRFLGDRHWPYTASFERIVSYFPAPLLALRTVKSEVAAGIPAQKIAWLKQNDPDWRTSGHYGVIQFKR